MSVGLRITDPLALGPAQLLDTDVPESDYPAFDELATYSLGDRTIAGHDIYESAQDANTGHPPLAQTDSDWWLWVGKTNRWSMFDLEADKPTVHPGGFWYEFQPGNAVDAVHLLGIVDGFSWRVRLTDPVAGLVYDSGELAIGWTIQEPNWWELVYGVYVDVRQTFVRGLPAYPQAVLRIDVVGGAACAVSALLVGQERTFGRGVRLGFRAEMRDAIKRDRNRWGDLRLRRAAWWDTHSLVLVIDNRELDSLREFLRDRRATVMHWSSSARWNTTQLLGFCTRSAPLISYSTDTDFSIEIEGIARDQ